MVRNAGITAKGSTRKKMEVKAISENLKTAAKVALMSHPKVVPHYSPAGFVGTARMPGASAFSYQPSTISAFLPKGG
jgi:hypothetical protein